MKQCPACGANNSPDAPSCSICGAALGQVASDVAARTLFGMPAVKIERAPPPAPPAPEPASLSRTRPGFRALGAVELDNSVGSLNIVPAAPPSGAASARPGGLGAEKGARAQPEPAPDEGMKQTLFGAPSPFKTADEPESEPPAPIRAAPVESTRLGMPSLNITPPSSPAQKAPPAADYQTLLGPPQPLAEALKARDAARQAAAAPPADDYRTLVGPPGSIADAARARDAARTSADHDVPPSHAPVPAGPSIIVDQEAIAHSLAAENPGPSIVVDADLDDAPVIVDDPPARGPGAALRPLPGDFDPRRGEPPATDELKRPGRKTERAAARFAQAVAEGEAATDRAGPAWIWLIVLIVLAAIAFAVWFTREARTGDARLDASPPGSIASAPGVRAPR